MGLTDPEIPEYPNYATAFALRCLVRAGSARDRPLIERMRKYLVSEQYGPDNGFDDRSTVFGGWGFGGGSRPRGSPGHMDLSYTRHVLDALREAGSEDVAVFERAQVFLRFVQKRPTDGRPQPPFVEPDGDPVRPPAYDGGFYFSPVVPAANKGGVEPARGGVGAYFRSYATATCDGVLALLSAGVRRDDERVLATRRWLERHPRLDYPEGVPRDDPNRFGDAIHFYHLAVRAEAYDALGWSGNWRAEMTALLAACQRKDGSFINDQSHLMKEDDPLLCTALAVVVLAHIRAR